MERGLDLSSPRNHVVEAQYSYALDSQELYLCMAEGICWLFFTLLGYLPPSSQINTCGDLLLLTNARL